MAVKDVTGKTKPQLLLAKDSCKRKSMGGALGGRKGRGKMGCESKTEQAAEILLGLKRSSGGQPTARRPLTQKGAVLALLELAQDERPPNNNCARQPRTKSSSCAALEPPSYKPSKSSEPAALSVRPSRLLPQDANLKAGNQLPATGSHGASVKATHGQDAPAPRTGNVWGTQAAVNKSTQVQTRRKCAPERAAFAQPATSGSKRKVAEAALPSTAQPHRSQSSTDSVSGQRASRPLRKQARINYTALAGVLPERSSEEVPRVAEPSKRAKTSAPSRSTSVSTVWSLSEFAAMLAPPTPDNAARDWLREQEFGQGSQRIVPSQPKVPSRPKVQSKRQGQPKPSGDFKSRPPQKPAEPSDTEAVSQADVMSQHQGSSELSAQTQHRAASKPRAPLQGPTSRPQPGNCWAGPAAQESECDADYKVIHRQPAAAGKAGQSKAPEAATQPAEVQPMEICSDESAWTAQPSASAPASPSRKRKASDSAAAGGAPPLSTQDSNSGDSISEQRAARSLRQHRRVNYAALAGELPAGSSDDTAPPARASKRAKPTELPKYAASSGPEVPHQPKVGPKQKPAAKTRATSKGKVAAQPKTVSQCKATRWR